MGPRQLLDRFQLVVRDYDLDGFADLFAEDGVIEYPFAPPGSPRRLVGRDEIRRVLAPAGRRAREAGRRISGFRSVVLHETADPEVIVVEFEMHVETPGSGRTHRLPYVHVIRVRNGEIVELRDYLDALALAEVTGQHSMLTDRQAETGATFERRRSS